MIRSALSALKSVRMAAALAAHLDHIAINLRMVKGWSADDAQRVASAIHALSCTTADPPAFEQWLIPRIWELRGSDVQAALDEVARVGRLMPDVTRLVECGAPLHDALDAIDCVSRHPDYRQEQ